MLMLGLLVLVGCQPGGVERTPATIVLPSDARAPQLVELTIDAALEALRTRRTDCVTLIRRTLDRIRAFDGPHGLNALVHVNGRALARARALDASYERSGELRPLHCIPVILKDNFDTADMPTEAGSIALRGSLPPDDAFMVRRLRAAGAIIVARSNMGEWAFSPYRTLSSTHGETRNPYDLERVPAGSSGGTAAAIAANLGVIGMGSDTGNSIRGPAANTALVGIRSTLGATSRDGIVPLLSNRDVGGPLMRTVRDAAIVFSVIAGPDPADPLTMRFRGRTSKDYTSALNPNGLFGARIGVLRALSDTDSTDPQVAAAFDAALDDLRANGALLVDPFRIPDFERLRSATGFCSRFRFDLDRYLASLGDDAPVRSLDEVVALGAYREESAGSMQWAMSQQGDPAMQSPPCVDVEGDPRRRDFLAAVLVAMNEHSVEAIVYPSWNNPPRRIGDLDSPHGNNSPVIAPHTGQPAITVPMGFTEDGLPLGLQLLARPFDEAVLFRLAYAYERATRHRRPPPGFGELPLAHGREPVAPTATH